MFQDYHLRVGEIVRDTAPPLGAAIVEQRLDEAEIGRAKFVTQTEVQPESGVIAAALPGDQLRADLIEYDVFASIYNTEKHALLASWRDRASAEGFTPPASAGLRHQVVRVVRDYGVFDRCEALSGLWRRIRVASNPAAEKLGKFPVSIVRVLKSESSAEPSVCLFIDKRRPARMEAGES